MARFGLLVKTPILETGYMISCILMILLLSLALADRINHLKFRARLSDQALAKSEKKYRNIFNNIQDVYFEISTKGKIIEISPSANRFFPFKRRELLGEPITKILTLDLDAFIHKVVNQNEVTNFETKLTSSSDRHSFGAIHAIFTGSTHQTSGKIIGSLRDISKQKKLEQQLLQSQKMEAIGTLTGGIYHDFNNLLSAIIGNAELGRLKAEKQSRAYEKFNKIYKSARKAADLTRQLLAFSRKQVIQPKMINLNTVINDMFHILRRVIEEDIEISLNCAPDIPGIIADSAQIEQIIMNLSVNARDAINENREPGSNRHISIKTGTIVLDDAYVVKHLESRVGPHVKLCVCDSGIGMTQETAGRIFDPFFTTKKKDRGTGLGLSTVFGIVKQNKGSLQVYSEPGNGTTITIYWPASDQPADDTKQKQSSITPPKGSATILLVEDDDGVRDYATEILSEVGFQVITASDGPKALDSIKNGKLKPDILFTDVIMPNMRGPELAKHVQAVIPDIKILFASGYTDNHIVKDGVLDPGINFIQKPFSAKEIIQKINQVLKS